MRSWGISAGIEVETEAEGEETEMGKQSEEETERTNKAERAMIHRVTFQRVHVSLCKW